MTFRLLTPPFLIKNSQDQIVWVVSQCFNDKSRKFIKIEGGSARWSSSSGKNDYCWNKDELISHIKWLIANIYVT